MLEISLSARRHAPRALLGLLVMLSVLVIASKPRAEPSKQPDLIRTSEASSSESVTRPDTRALIGGAVLFCASYGLALSAAEEEVWLAVPIAGPWISVSHGRESERLVLDGVAQLGGVALIAGSFLFPERTLGPARSSAPPMRLRVGASGPKLVVVGQF